MLAEIQGVSQPLKCERIVNAALSGLSSVPNICKIRSYLLINLNLFSEFKKCTEAAWVKFGSFSMFILTV